MLNLNITVKRGVRSGIPRPQEVCAQGCLTPRLHTRLHLLCQPSMHTDSSMLHLLCQLHILLITVGCTYCANLTYYPQLQSTRPEAH